MSKVVARYDSQIFASQRRGGISHYFAQLIRQFSTHSELEVKPVGFPVLGVNAYLPSNLMTRVPSKFSRFDTLRRLNDTMDTVRSSLRNVFADVYHPTYYFEPLRARKGERTVVTVHDMIPEIYPELFPQGNPHRYKRNHAENADAIICVSHTTLEDLTSLYPGLQARTFVIPLAASEVFTPSKTADVLPYIIFVGQRSGYKNFSIFCEAIKILRPLGIKGIAVGGGRFSGTDIALLRELDILSLVTQVSPSDTALRDLYRSATAMVCPSLYEGFGIPTLEAMASGCPALLADTPALREVGGRDGLYFGPYDAKMLASRVESVHRDATARREAVVAGLNRAGYYSWPQTARLTAQAYADVI